MFTNIILLAKISSAFSKFLRIGHGSTWPGHIALTLNQNFIKAVIKKNPHLKIILIAGTNGKTTTSKLLRFILEKSGMKVFQNESGANLLNGIASSLILNSDLSGKLNHDVAIFEVDENTLPLIILHIKPHAVLLLNLFRDQLDRYGEVNLIAKKWEKTLKNLPITTQVFSNGDDPQLSYITEETNLPKIYFGLESFEMSKKRLSHDVDFKYCPRCKTELEFEKISYSHMGKFRCPKCKFTNPKKEFIKELFYPLFGQYNKYNVNAACLIANKFFNISESNISSALHEFKPAFGRQETLIYKGKKIVILLSKNPTSFNQSLQAVSERNGRILLLVLNDRIPDGRDISWIWDVDFEDFLSDARKVYICGDRAYELGLRLKYTKTSKFQIEKKLSQALDKAIAFLEEHETLFILPTYSAMLEIRLILTGKKIL